MPPVIILNALFCTDSRISSSVSVQLQNTILAYSRPGRMKEVYIVVRVFLSNKYFSFARTFNFLSGYQVSSPPPGQFPPDSCPPPIPPWTVPPGQFPPRSIAPGQFPPGLFPPRSIGPQDNCPLNSCPPCLFPPRTIPPLNPSFFVQTRNRNNIVCMLKIYTLTNEVSTTYHISQCKLFSTLLICT